MAEISEILDLLWNPPRKRDRHPEMPSPNRFKPEDFGYYKNWGFAIYRTYYGPESDHYWDVLLQALRQQTLLSTGYYESDDDKELRRRDNRRHGYYKERENYFASLEIFKRLFRIFPQEDPSHLEGLDINGIRQVCRKLHHEAKQKMAGAKFCFALVADKAVLDGIAQNEFVVKAVGYDWDRIDHGGWGWVRLETGRLLELWEALLLADQRSSDKYYWMRCDGPESDLETAIWTGDCSLPYFDIYSKVQTATEEPWLMPGY